MWLSGLPETTQRLLLASVLEYNLEPQPAAEASDVLRRLCALLEVRGAQQLAELLTYHVLRSVCATLEIGLSGPAPTKAECLARFVAFVSFKGLRFALGQLGVEDLNVLSAVLAPLVLTHSASSSTADTDDEADTSTPITTAAAARAGQQSRIYETVADMSLRSWLDSLSPELAARVASDLGEEVAEDSTLTNALLDYACKHKFVLAESAMSFMDDDDTDTAHEKTKTTRKRRKSAPPARTGRRALSKRGKSCSDADGSVDIDENHRGEDAAVVEEEDEQGARCHPEVEELLVAIGLKPYVAACADKGITPERLIVMTEAELNTELGMSKRDTRHIVSNLRTIREQLEKAGGRPPIRVRRNRPKNKRTKELIADNDKWEWRGMDRAVHASLRKMRAQSRDLRKHRAICDMLPSLREMPAATAPSFAQAAPAGAGAASDDVASYTRHAELDSRLSHELHPMQEEEEEEEEEEPQQLMTPKQESEEDVVDLCLYATDPPSEDY